MSPKNIHFDPNHERNCENDDILHDFGNIIQIIQAYINIFSLILHTTQHTPEISYITLLKRLILKISSNLVVSVEVKFGVLEVLIAAPLISETLQTAHNTPISVPKTLGSHTKNVHLLSETVHFDPKMATKSPEKNRFFFFKYYKRFSEHFTT